MNSSRNIALAVCVAFVLAMAALLAFCRLDAPAAVPRPVPAAMIVDDAETEEYVDFADDTPVDDTPQPAFTEQVQQATAEAAERTAPVEPTPQELQAMAREEASRDIAQAFKSSETAHENATAVSSDKKGDSGIPENTPSAVDGSGQGSVSGGWIMPQFNKVRSTATGRIELRATIDADGRVVRVVQTGGRAPAGTDAALVERCMAEVRSRRFTRNDNQAPASATARITYTFK